MPTAEHKLKPKLQNKKVQISTNPLADDLFFFKKSCKQVQSTHQKSSLVFTSVQWAVAQEDILYKQDPEQIEELQAYQQG